MNLASRSRTATIVALSTCLLVATVSCGEEQMNLSLHNVQVDIARLTAEDRGGTSRFLVDDCGEMAVHVITTSPGIEAWVIAPDGRRVDAASVAGLGGRQFQLDARGVHRGLLLLPFTAPAVNQRLEFPCLGAGEYEVHYAAAGPLVEAVAVDVTLLTDSAVGVQLLASRRQVPAGDDVVLSVVVLDGDRAITDATVEVELLGPDDERRELTLADDGGEVDDRAGDGVYSGYWTTETLGEYLATARVWGASVLGSRFARIDTTRFEVVRRTGSLAGFSDRSVDRDGDRLIDAIVVDVDITAEATGSFQAHVSLVSASERSVRSAGRVDVEGGQTGTVTVTFDERALRALGEDGPYQIRDVRLVHWDEDERQTLADERVEAGQTRRYRAADFERPDFWVVGDFFDEGVDRDGDGKYEFLRIGLPVDVLHPGCYRWTLGIILGQREIRAEAAGPLQGPAVLEVYFDGGQIRDAGIDGPYVMTGFYATGPHGWLEAAFGPDTAAYSAEQFEAPAVPMVDVSDQAMGVCPCLFCFAAIDQLSPAPLAELRARHDHAARAACDRLDFDATCRAVRRLRGDLRRAERVATEAERTTLQAMATCARVILRHECKKGATR